MKQMAQQNESYTSHTLTLNVGLCCYNATLIKAFTVSEADIGQATLSSKALPPLDHTAGLQVAKLFDNLLLYPFFNIGYLFVF